MRSQFILFVLALVITACAPVVTPSATVVALQPTTTVAPQSTTTVAMPTAHIYENKTIRGITFLEPVLAWRDGKVTAKICYVWMGTGVWEIGQTTLKNQEEGLVFESQQEISIEPVSNPQPSQIRCVENIYTGVSNSERPLRLSMEIQAVNLGPVPAQGQSCQIYKSRLEASPEIKDAEIEVQCFETGPVPEITISKKSLSLSWEATRQLVGETIGLITGPWVFELTLK